MLTASANRSTSEQFTHVWNSSVPKLFKKEFLSPERSSFRRFTCFFCDGTFDNKYDLQQHQDVCECRPEGMEFLFTPSMKPCRGEKRAFFESFNLISTGKAEVLSRHKHDVVCDVIIVESSDDEDCEINYSVGQKTSGNGLLKQSPRKLNTEVRVSRRSCKRKSISASARSRAAKLLGIDVSSPLGLRLKQHICAGSIRDTSSLNCDEIERYCKEKTIDSLRLDLTFRRSEDPRLRKPKVLSPFTVTYRPTRVLKYCHVYKYSRRQREEFCKTYDTGLNARSRARLKLMKPVIVALRKLSLDKLSMTHRRVQSTVNSESRRERIVVGDCYDHDISLFQSSLILRDADTSSQTCILLSSHADEKSPDLRECLDYDDKTEAHVDENTHVDGSDAHTCASDSGVCVQLPTYPSSNSIDTCGTRSPGFSSTDGQRLVNMWSMSDRLPSLLFLCAVCNKKIFCETNSKSAIYSHYASHGIVDITLMTETLPDGQIDLKLVEVQHTPTSQGDHHQLLPVAINRTADQHTNTKETILHTAPSILVSTTLLSSPCRMSQSPGKRKHVKWADQESVAGACPASLVSADERLFRVLSADKNNPHIPSAIDPMRLSNGHMSASELSCVAKSNSKPVQVAIEPVMRRASPKPPKVDHHTSKSSFVSKHHLNDERRNGNASVKPQPGGHRDSGARIGDSMRLQQQLTPPIHSSLISTYSNSSRGYSVHSEQIVHSHSIGPRQSTSPSWSTVSHQTVVPACASACPIEPQCDTFKSMVTLPTAASQQFWTSQNETAPAAINLAVSAASASYIAGTIIKCMQAVMQKSMASLPSSVQRSPTAQSSSKIPADCIICID